MTPVHSMYSLVRGAPVKWTAAALLNSKRPMQQDTSKCPDSEPVQGCDDDRVYFDVEDRLERYLNKIDKTDGFMDQMKKYWPSNKKDNNCFWSHEWIKHGTCVSTLDPSCQSNPVEDQDVYDYFSKVLELRSQYDLYRALAAKKIFPSQSRRFKTAAIRAAIKEQFDVEPGLYCKNGNLEDIRLYFEIKNRDQYELVQPTTDNWMGNCPTTVSFPPKD
ncbi:ribonuclease T2-like [Gryganskiella cystojenkinii]|nr:ribonuclease T2-like [Gryganskiella cystojenkinii]